MNLKKALSPWTYLVYHITKLILYKIAMSNNRFVKMLEYDKKYRKDKNVF